MEECLLSYFKNHFSTEERTETFTVALSLFCLLVTQFYKGKLYMDDAMHKILFTILIKTITLCSSIIPCYLYDPTPIPTTTINQNLYQNKDSAMFITVWIVILPFDKFLFILIYPLTFKEIQTISHLYAWIWTRSVVCPFELQQFSSSCHHKRELLSPLDTGLLVALLCHSLLIQH